MNRLEDFGLVGASALTIVWLVGGTMMTMFVATALGEYPRVMKFVVYVMLMLIACGGLVAFWVLDALVEYRRRGYRVRVSGESEARYEERVQNDSPRALLFSIKTTGPGYPAPRDVRLPSETAWDCQVPVWACGRRAEIMERIADQLSNRVTFLDLDAPV